MAKREPYDQPVPFPVGSVFGLAFDKSTNRISTGTIGQLRLGVEGERCERAKNADALPNPLTGTGGTGFSRLQPENS
jgi:hypothetical protein